MMEDFENITAYRFHSTANRSPSFFHIGFDGPSIGIHANLAQAYNTQIIAK